MFAAVGELKVRYAVSGQRHEETIDPKSRSEFALEFCPRAKFRIDEVRYVEDTVYAILVSIVEPSKQEGEYFVGRDGVSFKVDELGLEGNFELSFLGR